ncbi:hypothetical protein LRAMOSA05171 [Lichtheimia ramosa]|uniref:Small ribosomal subunit protein mS38 n=1 Tax=Lichtheimia ramosa TaxID=688394 RepID=A0A077X1U9_9FUNG|nr:hypothetical protein LRAMOSA05171 [Lichtheimia ramosa]
MLAARGLLQCMASASTIMRRTAVQCVKRNASTVSTAADSAIPMEPSLPFMFTNRMPQVYASHSVTEYMSNLRPFSAPPAPSAQEGFQMTSILRKRRLKMNKHKHKKLRKRTRALRKRLGK